MKHRTVENNGWDRQPQSDLNRVLFERLPMGVCAVDNLGQVVMLNSTGTRLLGWRESLIRGKIAHEVLGCVIQKKRGVAGCPITMILQHREPVWGIRTRLRCRTGDWKWVELTATELEDNETGGVLLTFRDLTAEIQLADDSRRLASIPEESPFPIVEVDASGNVLYGNKAMTKLMKQASIRSRGFSAAFPPHFAELIERCLVNSAIEQDIEVVVGNKQYSWLFSPHPELGLVRGYGMDITDRKLAADELGTFADMLEEKNRELDKALIKAEAATQAKAAFLATMSHEIRTPLNGVIGGIEVLMDSSMTDDQKDCARLIQSSAEGLLSIINDILDFSKADAGKINLEIIPFDLHCVIDDVIEIFAERAQKKNLDLAAFIHPGVPWSLLGDPSRLRQILTNFIGNAMKFTEQGEVFVGVELENREASGVKRETTEQTEEVSLHASHLTLHEIIPPHVKIYFSVRDTGIGIPQKEQPQLFQAFAQADVSTTRKYGGTGLGLAISRQLTELMGGVIGMESEPGRGSTFWCCVPFQITSSHAVAQAGSRVEHSNIPLVCQKFLLLGCPPATRRMLEGSLQRGGASYRYTSECSQAEIWLKDAATLGEPYDGVLVDADILETGGLEFARIVRGDPLIQQTVLILLVPFGFRYGLMSSKQNGFSYTLTKPIRQSQLFECLKFVSENKLSGSHEVQPKKVLTLPVETEPADGHSLAPRTGLGQSILVAEDNPVNQRVATWALQKMGFRVTVVPNGREAIEALIQDHYYLVLMDWQMPEMDGLEATRAIRAREASKETCDPSCEKRHTHNERRTRPHIPIIGMTANAMRGDREKCLEAGMDDYLPKPIRADQLRKLIKQWLPSLASDASPASQSHVDQARQKSGEACSSPRFVDETDSSTYILGSATEGIAYYDVQAALQALEGDWNLLKSLLGLFLESAPDLLSQIRRAFLENNRGTLEKVSHQLKGALHTLQALPAAEILARLEKLAISGEEKALSSAYQELERHMDGLFPILKETLNSPTPSFSIERVEKKAPFTPSLQGEAKKDFLNN